MDSRVFFYSERGLINCLVLDLKKNLDNRSSSINAQLALRYRLAHTLEQAPWLISNLVFKAMRKSDPFRLLNRIPFAISFKLASKREMYHVKS